MNLIAEIGWNHLGDFNLLYKLVRVAKSSGATHVKFQVWSEANLKNGPWDHDGRREIYRQAELSKQAIKEIKALCDELRIKFLVSIFNWRDIDFLASVSNSEIKIPSYEISNQRLLQGVAGTFKHVFLSTGASTESEIDKALEMLISNGSLVTLMHCVSLYPCPDRCINLPRIGFLKKKHSDVGISDHSPDILSSLFALAMDIVAIEKHFTTDRNLHGRDNKFAILPKEFADLANAINRFKQMSQDKGINFQQDEEESRILYRSRWSA